MDVSIAVPDDVGRLLQARWGNLPQRTLEALALEAYRAGVLTEAEVQRMLGLASRWEVEAFLKRAQVDLDYTEADLEQDIATVRRLTSA
ncbi:MAG: UPF0175 family protein [Anaerolineae bacterium]|nr:UPF0175 family protein [Anaerolineae bacterium]